MYCLSELCQLGLVALFAIKMDATLVVLGLVMLTNQTLFFFLNILIPNKMGWLTHFELGLFGQCSFRNRCATLKICSVFLLAFRYFLQLILPHTLLISSVLKDLFKTALPLAFGSLLAYTEWEILTIFAAILGPAEGVYVFDGYLYFLIAS